MGIVSKLHCPKCNYESASKTLFRCPECRRVLEVDIAIGHLSRTDFVRMREGRDRSIWRWFDFFPVAKPSSRVSLGEGGTPLILASRLGAYIGIHNLYLKNDTVLPTGSLKDRSNSVGLSVAKELGFDTATVMSTGGSLGSGLCCGRRNQERRHGSCRNGAVEDSSGHCVRSERHRRQRRLR